MGAYSRRSNRRRALRAASIAVRYGRYSPMILTGIAGILLVTSMINPDMWKDPRVATADALSPAVSAIGAPFRFIGDTVGEITGLTQIRADNARLKSENDQLKEWYQTAMLLRAENQSLKDLLNVLPEPEQSYITTRVIGDSGSSFVRTLLIQAGTMDGVQEGQAVMGSQGMIGRIIEAGENASRILLLTDINSHVPVIIEGVNQRAILVGNNEASPELEHLPPDILITKRLRIVTSGTGGQFPAGLPIGEISSVVNGTVKVKLFSESYSAGYVQVVEKPMDPDVRKSLDALRSPPQPSQNSLRR
ncbi:MAG TPA: rod shape-determining protein MreC [Alphaproteobacteria bacterium]|jgi:rod shape-determining protein MreC|nr:rod shape-determining protein MreC [Micavibrio sp.]HRK97122.1 rod shape-determining protein MreC [Alphaproteobacteria bacterium]